MGLNIGSAIGKIIKQEKRIFKKVVSDPLMKITKSDDFKKLHRTAVIAAMIYFTAGAAAGKFAAPAAGQGTAGAGMSGVVGASGAAGASAAPVGGMAGSTPGLASAAPVGGMAGSTPGLASSAMTDMAASSVPGVSANTGAMVSTGSMQPSSTEPTGGGMFDWMQKNPMMTMMLGQAGTGAYQGYLMDKQQEREDKIRREQGLMGYDYHGKYRGVVSNQMTPEAAVAEPATLPPTVVSPAEQMQRTQLPIARADLPELNKKGQLITG